MTVTKSEQQWKQELSPSRYRVLREKGTETPFSGEYTEFFAPDATAAAPADSSCSIRPPNLNPAAAGPALTPPSRERLITLKTTVTECIGWKSYAQTAARISDTFFPTAPRQPVSATVSTPSHSILRRSRNNFTIILPFSPIIPPSANLNEVG